MKHSIILIALAFIGVSCGTLDRGAIQFVDGNIHESTGKEEPDKGIEKENRIPVAVITSVDSKRVRSKLDEAYQDWQGIPYILGGTDYSGVDCSAFMQIVFEDYLGKRLPRVTTDQLTVGKSVKRGKIEVGDLIFFRTGRKTLHVGVAISRSEFLHASTTQGVIISSLEDRYWSDFYLTTRRVL